MSAALLFDLDGTLADTDHLHLAAFNEVMAPYGINLTRDAYARRVMGKANKNIARELVPEMPLDKAMRLLDAKEAVYRSHTRKLAPGDLAPIAGLGDLLDWAAAQAIPAAVVTNAPPANAELVLEALGLTARFHGLIIASELAEMKPHPLPYLTALQQLGAEAAQSIVFEDSPSGISAGSAAGMPVVGLMTTLGADALITAGATRAIRDYEDPGLLTFIAARTGRQVTKKVLSA